MSEIQIKDFNLAITIAKAIDKKRGGLLDAHSAFTSEELSKIESLDMKIDIHTDLKMLSVLKNLKNLSLTFESDLKWNRTDDSASAHKNRVETLNAETNSGTDFSSIESLTNLESLSIKNHPNLKTLDVTNFRFLNKLEIINNNNFQEIKNLDKLQFLKSLKICGSDNAKGFDYGDLLKNSINLTSCLFDLKMLPDFVRKTVDLQEKMKQSPEKKFVSIGFVDRHNSDRNENVDQIYFPDAFETYTKATEIVKHNTSPECSDYSNFYGLYRWVIGNIKYDHENLNKEKQGNKEEDGKMHFVGNLRNSDSIRSTYTALKDGRVVCSGYANLLTFLCKCANIDCQYVICESKQNANEVVFNGIDHAIVKLKVGDKTYYSDPTWDAGRCQQGGTADYFLKNKEEISKTHTLSYLEVSEPNSPILADSIKIIKNNFKFAMNMQQGSPYTNRSEI